MRSLVGLAAVVALAGACSTSEPEACSLDPASDLGPPPGTFYDAHVDAEIDPATCCAPEEVEITCDPLPAGAEGCRDRTFFGAIPGPEGADYPLGCTLTYPFCHNVYPAYVVQCRCESTATSRASWVCPN